MLELLGLTQYNTQSQLNAPSHFDFGNDPAKSLSSHTILESQFRNRPSVYAGLRLESNRIPNETTPNLGMACTEV